MVYQIIFMVHFLSTLLLFNIFVMWNYLDDFFIQLFLFSNSSP